jgi:hypothetical protein
MDEPSCKGKIIISGWAVVGDAAKKSLSIYKIKTRTPKKTDKKNR